MSSANETTPEKPSEHKAEGRDYTAPNGEYVPAFAIAKLLHLPGFEAPEDNSEPTSELPNAS